MGKKTDCLMLLKEKHINVHEFREIFDYHELLDFVIYNRFVTIRFDRYDLLEELPFYIIRVDEYEMLELEEKLNKAMEQNEKLVEKLKEKESCLSLRQDVR